MPPKALDDGIVYDRPLARPARLDELAALDLVRVVELLDGERSVGGCLVDAGVDETRWESFLRALGSLRDSYMLADAGGDRAA